VSLSLRRIVAAVIHGTATAASRRPMPTRVGIGDLDVNLHMNQARYLERMEIARWHWFAQRRQLGRFFRDGVSIVAVAFEMRFDREARLFDRFEVHTHLARRSGRLGEFEQACARGDRVHAWLTGRFLVVGRGGVLEEGATAELLDPWIEGPLPAELHPRARGNRPSPG
jgi:thioesterase-3